jgi:hypothetical protein
MGFWLDYGKLIETSHQSCLLEFQALFYTAQFGNDTSRLVERKKFISFGLSKYVDFWNVGIAQRSTHEMKMKYVEYWEDILLHLSRLLLPQRTTLLKGF